MATSWEDRSIAYNNFKQVMYCAKLSNSSSYPNNARHTHEHVILHTNDYHCASVIANV